jgi:hypothetical protein
VWGVPVWLIFFSNVKSDNFWYHSILGLICFLFFCGCILISIISSWIYFLAPLHFFYLAILTALLTIYLFLFQRKKIISAFIESNKSRITISLVPFLFIVVSLLLFLVLSSLQPVNGDTQIYHMQLIRWQSEYKIVPGIVNLYPRLGLGSNWFNLISFFYFPFFKNENFTYLNAAIVCWFFIWLFLKWNFHYQKHGTDSSHNILSVFYFLLLLYFMFDWQLFRDSANSTNYDFVINAITVIVISFFIEGIFINRQTNQFSFVVFLFSLSAITFKLSGIFILFIVLYHVLVSWKTVKTISVFLSGIVILLPMLIKNYIITGYPLFPATLTINTPDWILPKPMASVFYDYITLSNKFYNYQWSFIHQIKHTPFNWIPYWFKGILWQHKVIIVVSSLSVFFFLKKTNLPIDDRKLRSVIFNILFMLAGWFFTAPDPGRFGYGALLSLSFLTMSLLIYPLSKKIFYTLVLIPVTIIIAVYAFKKSNPIIKNPQYIFYPESYKNPSYEIIKLSNINLKLPERINNNWDRRCYFTTLPCIIQKNPYLKQRGKSISDGFKMELPQIDTSFIFNYEY